MPTRIRLESALHLFPSESGNHQSVLVMIGHEVKDAPQSFVRAGVLDLYGSGPDNVNPVSSDALRPAQGPTHRNSPVPVPHRSLRL